MENKLEYFHGSVVPGIKILEPKMNPDSNLTKPCIYFTSKKDLAVFYIWNRPFKWLTYGFKDGMVKYTESFKDGLEYFYKGVSGYIYSVDQELIIDEKVGIQSAAISEEPVKIKNVEYISDVYEKILEENRNGEILLRRYDDLDEQEHNKNNKMVLNAIKRMNLIEEENEYSIFVKEKFPEIWNMAIKENQES
jgi:hypothetical protein